MSLQIRRLFCRMKPSLSIICSLKQSLTSVAKSQRSIERSDLHNIGIPRTFTRDLSLFDQTTKMAACEQLSKENIRDFLDSVDTILTDCDGVLWNDKDPVPGAPDTMQKLKQMGKRIFYVTNNSTKSRDEYKEKCASMGLPAEKEDIICTAYVTARYITDILKYKGKVYVIGSTGMQQELDAAGISHTGIGPDTDDLTNYTAVDNLELDPEIKCVVVGFDKYFNFSKLARATCYAQQPDCHFLGTNIDSGLPMAGGTKVMPGTGSIVKCVAYAAQKEPILLGKPEKPIFDVTMEMHNLNPAKTVMIGDRLNTDIALGHNCGFRTLHVHTGFHKLSDVHQLMESDKDSDKKQIPHYYLPSVADMLPLIADAYQ